MTAWHDLRSRGLVWPTAVALAGLVILAGLGTWQMQRRSWKENLLTTIDARATIAALPWQAWRNLKCRPVPEVSLEEACDYMHVTVRGRFDHAGERHVFISVPRQPSGVGGPGYWVFTPLRLEGGGEIYVNRGFVPEAAKPPERRAQGQTEGDVVLTGLIRSAEPRGSFSGANDQAKNVYYVRDPLEFRGSAINVSAASPGPDPNRFYIDQTSAAPDGGLPLPLAGKIDLPNRHLEYALTWYGLAATLAAVYAVFAYGRWKRG